MTVWWTNICNRYHNTIPNTTQTVSIISRSFYHPTQISYCSVTSVTRIDCKRSISWARCMNALLPLMLKSHSYVASILLHSDGCIYKWYILLMSCPQCWISETTSVGNMCEVRAALFSSQEQYKRLIVIPRKLFISIFIFLKIPPERMSRI